MIKTWEKQLGEMPIKLLWNNIKSILLFIFQEAPTSVQCAQCTQQPPRKTNEESPCSRKYGTQSMTTESEGRRVKEQLIDAAHLGKSANIGNILAEFYSTSAKASVLCCSWEFLHTSLN